MFKRGLEFQFDLLYRTKEAHSRIVWALSWSHDDTLYATASRENKKSVKVWDGKAETGVLHSELPEGSVPCATSLQFFPSKI
jgi:WD40 repeat protein